MSITVHLKCILILNSTKYLFYTLKISIIIDKIWFLTLWYAKFFPQTSYVIGKLLILTLKLFNKWILGLLSADTSILNLSTSPMIQTFILSTVILNTLSNRCEIIRVTSQDIITINSESKTEDYKNSQWRSYNNFHITYGWAINTFLK